MKIAQDRITLGGHEFIVKPLNGKRWFDVARFVMNRAVDLDNIGLDATTSLCEMLVNPEHMRVRIDGKGAELPMTEDVIRRTVQPATLMALVTFALKVSFPYFVPRPVKG